MDDYYQILQVERHVSSEELKKAFHILAMLHHPDHNPDDFQAKKKFQEISEAYEILRDKDKRDAYDRWLNMNTSFHKQHTSKQHNQHKPHNAKDTKKGKLHQYYMEDEYFELEPVFTHIYTGWKKKVITAFLINQWLMWGSGICWIVTFLPPGHHMYKMFLEHLHYMMFYLAACMISCRIVMMVLFTRLYVDYYTRLN